MKKVGIIGGAGPLASAYFYRALVEECYHHLQKVPDIILLNIPFKRELTPRTKLQLQKGIDLLIREGVDIAALACNTLHLYLQKTSLPFVPLPKSVMQEALKNKHRTFLLLGTRRTCRSSLYESAELKTVCPSPEDQKVVERIIDSILRGQVLQQDAHLLQQIVERFPTPVDCVVLGCTELPVLFDRFKVKWPLPTYDSIKIGAKNLRGLL